LDSTASLGQGGSCHGDLGAPLTIVEFALPALAAAMIATATGAAAQAVTGFGFSLLSVPVFVLLVGPAHAVRLGNVLAVGVNVLLLAREHRAVRLSNATRLLGPAVVVTPVAAYVVHRTDPPLLSVIVGVLIVVCALWLVSGRRAEWLRGRSGLLGAGAISAAMNTASGVGGPAVAMYALNAEWPAEMMRPTLQVYFLGLNILSFLALGPVALRVGPAVGLAAAILAGFALGTTVVRRLDTAMISRLVVLLAVAGGTTAIVRGILTG
jgi:uncharacterized membrane protein YfcA